MFSYKLFRVCMHAFQSYTMLFNEFGDRNVWRHGEFKDFKGPVLFSSTFKALNLGEKIQVLSRMRGNPVLHY